MELIYPTNNIQEIIGNETNPECSKIQEYFAGSTVFVTGATGFLGRLLVEKLLRTCRDLERIYILMRPKKEKTIEKRFEEYFDNIVYDRLKEENPKALEKMFIMIGDCSLPDLGISEKDKEIFFNEVNCIFHVAATVRFDEKIQKATYINVRCTRDILRMAKQSKNLTSFVHVSTAFSHCTRKNIDEEFYDPPMTGEQLLTVVEDYDEETLDALTKILVGKWPNTYVFTKAIAEDVVKKESANLPIAVIRPSIVVATAQEPLPGWIDNFYGATGVIAGIGVGLIRTLHCKPNNFAEIIPADYVINNMIALAWNVHHVKTQKITGTINGTYEKKDSENASVFNCVSAPQRPLTWQECMDTAFKYGVHMVSVLQVWHHCIFLNSNKYVHLLLHYLLHILPAYIIDCFAFMFGKKPQLIQGYKKISKFLRVLSFFSTQQWNFGNNNTQQLWKKLNNEDKRLFNFDMTSLDWDSYFATYMPGIRLYVLKDPMETLPKGLAKAFRLKIAHYILVTIVVLTFLKFMLFLLN